MRPVRCSCENLHLLIVFIIFIRVLILNLLRIERSLLNYFKEVRERSGAVIK